MLSPRKISADPDSHLTTYVVAIGNVSSQIYEDYEAVKAAQSWRRYNPELPIPDDYSVSGKSELELDILKDNWRVLVEDVFNAHRSARWWEPFTPHLERELSERLDNSWSCFERFLKFIEDDIDDSEGLLDPSIASGSVISDDIESLRLRLNGEKRKLQSLEEAKDSSLDNARRIVSENCERISKRIADIESMTEQERESLTENATHIVDRAYKFKVDREEAIRDLEAAISILWNYTRPPKKDSMNPPTQPEGGEVKRGRPKAISTEIIARIWNDGKGKRPTIDDVWNEIHAKGLKRGDAQYPSGDRAISAAILRVCGPKIT